MLDISVCAHALTCNAHLGVHNACGGAGGCVRHMRVAYRGAVLVFPPESSLWELTFPRTLLVSQLCCSTRASALEPLILRCRGAEVAAADRCEKLAVQGACKVARRRPSSGCQPEAFPSVWCAQAVKGCQRQFCKQNERSSPLYSRRDLRPWKSKRWTTAFLLASAFAIAIVHRGHISLE